MSDTHDIDMRPVLGEIAKQWQRIAEHVHPSELTVSEALTLLNALQRITDRLDAEHDAPACDVVPISAGQGGGCRFERASPAPTGP